MSRTIMTAAELDALPVGSVILDNMGDAGLIDERDGERLVQYAETSRVSLRHAAKHYLPATVLHDPSAPAPAPSVVPEAAPSATRDEVSRALFAADPAHRHGADEFDRLRALGLDVTTHYATQAAALLARFNITPKEPP